MSKRSRDVSFSPTAEPSSSPGTTVATTPDADESRPNKLMIENTASDPEVMMNCSLPPHREPLKFDSVEAFDLHYAKEHTNRCSECGRNFPSAHILSLHLEENHNPLRLALQERGEKTYSCFLPDCDRRCSTPQKRRLHLIDKHGFPRFYNFRVVDKGIDKVTSMLRDGQRRRISTSTDPTQSLAHRRRTSSLVGALQQAPMTNGDSHGIAPKQKTAEADIDDLDHSMSALRFVPSSVTRRQGKKT